MCRKPHQGLFCWRKLSCFHTEINHDDFICPCCLIYLFLWCYDLVICLWRTETDCITLLNEQAADWWVDRQTVTADSQLHLQRWLYCLSVNFSFFRLVAGFSSVHFTLFVPLRGSVLQQKKKASILDKKQKHVRPRQNTQNRDMTKYSEEDMPIGTLQNKKP